MCNDAIRFLAAFGIESAPHDFIVKRLTRLLSREQPSNKNKDTAIYPIKKIVSHHVLNGQTQYVVQWPSSTVTRDQITDQAVVSRYHKAVQKVAGKKFIEVECDHSE